MRKIKIGMLLISDAMSGAEKVIYCLAKNLDKKDKEVQLFLNSEISPFYQNIPNIKIHDLGIAFKKNKIRRIYHFIRVRNKFKRIIKKEKFDILNINLLGSFIIFYNLKQTSGAYLVTTLHGTEVKYFFDKRKGFNSFLDKVFLKKTFNDSDILISVSKHQISRFSTELNKKTVVIPNGVDSKLFKPLKIKPKKNVVLFAGRYIDIKGIREIITVANQLPQYEFWFAGQGPLASLINLPNTKNLGFKTTEELVKLYNQATICVFPSYREGFPLCGLEAMSCGKSVIATPLGFSEYIENGKDGIIIPAKDEKALKEAIVKLMSDEKLREKLGRNARKKALKYSWQKVAQQYYALFKKVISENPRQQKPHLQQRRFRNI